MIDSFKKKIRHQALSEVLLAFVQSWNMHGQDETSICSGALDVLRAYLEERPCCIWKHVGHGLTRVCERGMVDIFFETDPDKRQKALEKTLVSGASEYDATGGFLRTDVNHGFDGFLHVPVKAQENVTGILSVAALKREGKDRGFVQALECLGRLIAISLQHSEDRDTHDVKQRQLRAELEATTRELAQTNNRLIERVRELKAMGKELEKRVEELTHANRAKDEFLSVVSHELRTPLTSLNGFLCVLLDQEAGPITRSQEKFLSIAKQSADRLNVLISDLLDISRIESGRLNLDMKVCSLQEIILKSMEGLKSSAEAKNIEIESSLSVSLPEVWGDPNRLQQVVDNILSNAIKFTQHGGHVRVNSEDKGDGVQVSIEDNGPGIDPVERRKIFDMFYQVDASTRRATGGAGLGLAIANGIVSMHGGRLWVDSEKGNGTAFTFIIPRHKAKKVA